MPQKIDWPPLHPEGGMLNVSRSMLVALAVEPFLNRTRREALTAKLFLWMDAIAELGVPLTCWIDGSYCTLKEDPNDIDLCVLANSAAIDSLDNDAYLRFQKLINRPYVRAAYDLDVFLVDSLDNRDQGEWRELFGKGHDRKTTKGIFVMKAKE